MKAAFLPRLVNHPFGDPGLYVAFRYEGRAMLFDLGRIDRRPAAELLRLTHVFVSHTHMDHFIGFDHLLRLFLARDTQLEIFGPPGIIANVRGKLAGYTWNLVGSYKFVLVVHEVGFTEVETVRLPASTAFAPEPVGRRAFDGVLYESSACRIRTAHMDHKIPSLAFALEEKTRLNVRPEKLAELGVPAGPWLNELKAAIRDQRPADFEIVARWRENATMRSRTFRLGDLERELVVVTPGQKIAYVVDTLFSRANLERVVSLVKGADIFFCESLFLDADRHEAMLRCHLTARQAGTLARAAAVKRLETFHYSPRYDGNAAALRDEAQAAFRGEIAADVPDQ